jgi:hypothetical protein
MMGTVETTVELFHPHLVLGVSDELRHGAEPCESA